MTVKKILSLLLCVTLILCTLVIVNAQTDTDSNSTTQINSGKLNRVAYNNEELVVDLGAGLYAAPIVVDMNADGCLDLVVSSEGVPYNGTYVYYGSVESRNFENEDYLLMDKGKYLTGGHAYMAGSYLYDENGDYEDTIVSYETNVYNDFKTGEFSTFSLPRLDTPGTINGVSYNVNSLRHNFYSFADVDGDSNLDLIRTISTWDEYGWSGKYDSNGVWGKEGGDALHSWVFWAENTSENQLEKTSYGELNIVNVKLEDGSIEPLDCYGSCSAARFCDLDKDGDLDIILPSFMDDIFYFENISDVKSSNLNSNGIFLCNQGKNIKLSNGNNTTRLEDLQMELCMLNITEFDWNNDGFVDLIVGEEDGRVSLLENTGLFDENNIPVFNEPKYFKTPADSVKNGILNTPYSIDWDGDGDEDIITGDSAGFISFIENVTPSDGNLSNPVWNAPIRLTDDYGNVIRHIAGYNGSIQGPAEEKWGYSVVTVADWDNDGILDIMANDIWGKVVWYRGISGETTKVNAAQPVNVEWINGAKYPSYNWWKPTGNELATYWRTTPFMIDINDDGLTDLVMCDYQGYMAFYERYDDNGTLKLKEGKRIFYNEDLSPVVLATGTDLSNGENRQKFTMADWNDDGKLDLIKNDAVSVRYFENVSTEEGGFVFRDCGTMYNIRIAAHTTCPTVCDWDKDGQLDVLVGAEDGHLYYLSHENTVDDTAVAKHLVAHYDFEGNTPLADKATGGSIADNLKVNDSDNVAIKNGTATITGAGALYAQDSEEISPTEELTVFFRAKFSGFSSGTPSIVDKRSFNNSTGGENRSFGVYAENGRFCTTFTAEPGSGSRNNAVSSVSIAEDTWNEYALVIRKGSDGYLDSYLYMSKEAYTYSEDDFVVIASNTYGTATNISDSHAPFVIGNNVGFQNFSFIQTFDDVRIYDIALTSHQLNKVLPYDIGVGEEPIDSLVSKWTFNGSEGKEFWDTATYGNDSDTLVSAGNDGTATFENGVVTLTGNGALKAVDSTDISPTGEFTLFFRAKISGTPGDFSLVDKRRFTPSSRSYGVYVYQNVYGVQINSTFGRSSRTPMADVWRNYALVVSKLSDTQFTFTLYMSTGENPTLAEDYITLLTQTVTADSIFDSDIPLLIGNDINMASKSFSRSFDEIRIYSTALSLSQILSIKIDTTIPVSKIEQNLVSKWTFNGSDGAEYKDSAKFGQVSDTAVSAGNEGTATFKDGIVTLTGNGAIKVPDSTDISPTGAFTVFFKSKLTGTLCDFSFIDKRSFSAYSYGDTRAYALFSYNNEFVAQVNTKSNWNSAWTAPEMNVWREHALVVTKNGDGTFTQTMYISTVDNPTSASDFKCYSYNFTADSIVDNEVPLLIGNDIHLYSKTVDRSFDEVRIYNCALGVDELANIEIETDFDIKELELLIENTSGITSKQLIYSKYLEGYNLALSTAKELLSKTGATNEELQNAYTNLYVAYKNLLVPGNINNDSAIDITDLVLMNNIRLGTAEAGFEIVTDIDSSGQVDDGDTSFVRKAIISNMGEAIQHYSGLKLSVIGDSISTYDGYSNNANYNSTIYKNSKFYPQVYLSDVKDTWWMKTADTLGMNILVNNSWSGSKVLDSTEAKSGYGTRSDNLYNDISGDTPDIIAIYLGINDYIHTTNQVDGFYPTGELSNFNSEDIIVNNGYITPTNFVEAYAIMLSKIKSNYKDANIYCFTLPPNGRTAASDPDYAILKEYNNIIKTLASFYGINIVELYSDDAINESNYSSITGEGLHPNSEGMGIISAQFINKLCDAF